MPYDLNRILLLLNVMEKASGYPSLKPIADAVWVELMSCMTPVAPAVEPPLNMPTLPNPGDA
jgi:hypothetical protein